MLYIRKIVIVFIYCCPIMFAFGENFVWQLIAAALLVIPINAFAFSTVYHKLFAHRAFKPKAWVPYAGTLIGVIMFIGTPRHFVSLHRMHHRFSDTLRDPHSPKFGKRYTFFPAFFKNPNVVIPPQSVNDSLSKDFAKDYPILSKITDLQMLLSFVVFNFILLLVSVDMFAVSLLITFLIINLHGYANTFFHKVNSDGSVTIVDNAIGAKFISPEFNHKTHHDAAGSSDFTSENARDWMSPIIERFLSR